jgi:hypothetical protein
MWTSSRNLPSVAPRSGSGNSGTSPSMLFLCSETGPAALSSSSGFEEPGTFDKEEEPTV